MSRTLSPSSPPGQAAASRVGSKGYFSASGTVSTWWREEKWPGVLKPFFEAQLQAVVGAADWSGKRVLDAGTGFGRFARALAAAGASVSAIDISSEMLAMARSKTAAEADIGWYQGDVEQLPFAAHAFDAVVCAEVFMHIPDPAAAVREFARVVRPGGVVIFGINNRYSLSCLVYGAQMATTIRLYHWLAGKPLMPYHSNTVRQARGWVDSAGLRVRREFGVGLLHPTAVSLPGARLPIMPRRLSHWALEQERKRGLGNTWMKHVAKAFLVVAARP